MGKTSIEWCDHSINPIRARLGAGSGHYCEKVSPGCKNCYSSALQRRFGMPSFAEQRRSEVEPYLHLPALDEVIRRRKPTRYFWCDMTDLFGAWVTDEWIDQCFATMALTQQHTHLVLTKRPERMRAYFAMEDRDAMIEGAAQALYHERTGEDPSMWLAVHTPIRNVWLGVSCEDQPRADARVPLLLETPAAVRFVSAEPLLGPIDFSRCGLWLCKHWNSSDSLHAAPWCPEDPAKWWWEPQALRGVGQELLDWIIVGSESGPGRRPMQIEWARSLVDQCEAARVPIFVKQISSSADQKGGNPEHWPPGRWPREFPS